MRSPRERYTPELQQRLQDLFLARFGGESVDQHVSLGESEQARIHFTVHVPGPIPDVPLGDLEHEVVALTRTWDDRLRERLVATYGEERGVRLAETYRERFPDYYKNSTDISMALVDVEQFEHLAAGEDFRVALQNERGGPQDLTRVGIYKTGST